MNLLKKKCPNCQHRGDGNELKQWCVACADPYTGINRGWVWRWHWLHHWLVSRHNFKILAEREAAAVDLQKTFAETDTAPSFPEGTLPVKEEQPMAAITSDAHVVMQEPIVSTDIKEAAEKPAEELPTVSDEISEGRSVPGVSSTNAGSECEHGAMRDAVKTVHPAIGDSRINGQWSQGGKRASAADKAPSEKHAAENPPSSFPEIEVNIEPKKELKPKESDARFNKPSIPVVEPPLRPRRTWEKWYKAQGNSGTDTHAEWKRRAKEVGIKMGE